MVRREAWLGIFLLIALSALGAGCSLGAAQQLPVDPVGTGDLKPTLRDPDAGVVTVRSGFDLRKYSAIAIVQFPVTDSGVMNKEEVSLLLTMPFYFQTRLVGRLRETKMFTSVEPVNEGTGLRPPMERCDSRDGSRVSRPATIRRCGCRSPATAASATG
jgi:hypothetical protein